MKTLRIFTLLTFVLAFGLCSCSSDEESFSTQILGTWKGNMSTPLSSTDSRTSVSTAEIIFKDDLTSSFKVMEDDGDIGIGFSNLSYKIDGKDVIMNANIPGANIHILLKVSSLDASTMITKIYTEDGKPMFEDKDYTFTKKTK